MYKRPTVRKSVILTGQPPYPPVENSLVYQLIHRRPFPPYVPQPRGVIRQIDNLIFGLRYQGVPEDELARLREENKYIPPPPPKRKVKKPKKKQPAVPEDVTEIFSKYTTVKKKVLKAVIKKK